MSKLESFDYEIFFLSYKEPNAQENYKDLVEKLSHSRFNHVPSVKQVTGIKGIDNAHKRCAQLSSTEYFLTIDADCKIDADFFCSVVPFIEPSETSVLSFPAQNTINGLLYGNGSLKLWPKEIVLNSPEMGLDYCYSLSYKLGQHINKCYACTYPNGTAEQAWRAGFREGAKLSVMNTNSEGKINSIPEINLKRLRVWCSIGSDVINGTWAMLGARQGIIFAMKNSSKDISKLINDYDWLYERFFSLVSPDNNFNEKYIHQQLDEAEKELTHEFDFEVMTFNSRESRFFKISYFNPIYIKDDKNWVKMRAKS